MQNLVNKIYLGDSLEIIKKISDNSIDLIVTDPPYLHKISGKGGCLGNRNKFTDKNGILKMINGFDISSHLKEWERILKKFNAFIFCSNKQISSIMKWGEEKDFIVNLLVWYKTNAAPFANGVFKSDLEFCIHIRERGTTFQGKANEKSKIYISQCERSKYGHPTEKPLKLIEKYIKIGSNKGDIVLDPFLGSGTTVNACIDLHRQYIGIEIDEKYYKIACNRRDRAIGKVGLFK